MAVYNSGRVADLVKYATSAAKLGRGHIMWMCWQPCGAGEKPTRMSSPRSGSQLLMLSKPGAIHLGNGFFNRDIDPGHFDVALLRWLVRKQAQVGAAYLLPALGNYDVAHVRGCDVALKSKARRSCWQEKWSCPGTRVSEDPKRRTKYWCSFTQSGSAPSLGVVSVDDSNTLMWRSPAPKSTSSASSEGAVRSASARAQDTVPKRTTMIQPSMAMAGSSPPCPCSSARPRLR